MQWDEVTHFTGGLLLSRGQVGQWVWTNSFYPPAFDFVTTSYFVVAGASVLTGRLVAVTFSVFSLFVVYLIAEKMYDAKTAIMSAIFFGLMPGIVWLSRMAMIETMLMFTFCLSMFFFFGWLRTNRNRDRIVSGVAFAVGVAVKYQMLVVTPIIMLTSLLLWKREYLKNQISRYLKLPLLAFIVAAVAVAVFGAYELFASGVLGPWIYAIQVGTADKSLYSIRFPTPIFYFIEMVWPYSNVHPISLLLYVTGLAGLGLLAYRRKTQDKFLLIWFVAIYLIFTMVPNRQWRYITLLFPVLAISAADLVTKGFSKVQKTWQTAKNSSARRYLLKFAAAVLMMFAVTAVFFSSVDANSWVAKDQIQVPIEQATAYLTQDLSANQSVMVAFPLNLINMNMVWFYLNAKTPSQTQVWQYPEFAVDSYMPNFNVTEFIGLCTQHNVKYVLLYENGKTQRYFNTTLTEQEVYSTLTSTGRFTLQTTFGREPQRIFVFSIA